MLKPHDRIFICLDKTPECDGRTDGWTEFLWPYYSGLHCEQCGRVVKILADTVAPTACC